MDPISYDMPFSQKLLNCAVSIGISDTDAISFIHTFVVKPIQWLEGQEEIQGLCNFISKHVIARIIGATTSVFAAINLTFQLTLAVIKTPLAVLYNIGITCLPESCTFEHIIKNIEDAVQSVFLVLFGSIMGIFNPSFIARVGFPISERSNIPVFGYHKIDCSIEDPWTISPRLFLQQLNILYKNNYELCTFREFAEGYNPANGKRLAVITFDDGDESQFNVLEKKDDGTLIIDPNCAVGIMMQFKQKHPTFRCTATFFVNTAKEAGTTGNKAHYLFSSRSEQEAFIIDKLAFLLENGFEIGAHGHLHQRFDKLTVDQIKEDLKAFDEAMDDLKEDADGALDDLEIVSFAWPHGMVPSKDKRAIIDARFNYIADYGMHAKKVDPNGINNKAIPRLYIGPSTCFSQYIPRSKKSK